MRDFAPLLKKKKKKLLRLIFLISKIRRMAPLQSLIKGPNKITYVKYKIRYS